MIRYDKAKIWKVLFLLGTPWETEMNDVYILKGLVQNGETSPFFWIRDIYTFSFMVAFFFPVVFGKKKSPRRIGRKRVDPGAAGRNRMVGPIGSASALAVKLQHRKKENGLEVKSTTPWKMINMEPENDSLEDDFPFQLGDF